MSVCVSHSMQRGAKLQHKPLEEEISQSCDCLLEAKLLFISKYFW